MLKCKILSNVMCHCKLTWQIDEINFAFKYCKSIYFYKNEKISIISQAENYVNFILTEQKVLKCRTPFGQSTLRNFLLYEKFAPSSALV